ncbi:membrane protein [Arachidicoccus rhizosphaerae]|uniref:Membrane protein n=1 Tax=Arachidicoccus rhizosphaerae TaxID=551991 RepID=A0A1H4BJM9_9BACT|nr:YihY/virulence factor BrkB family protein [Arachidicoccus rhizosphaerae]SEA48405.1 membrane protein [Arachidicoccus rhizosphaerae]
MIKRIKHIFKVLKQTISDFSEINIMRMSAALAYYTIFGLAPMIIIVLSLSSFFVRKKPAGYIFNQLNELLGANAASQVHQMIENVLSQNSGTIMQIVGIIALVVSATGIFTEIQDSINVIWRVKAKPRKGWLKLVLNRLLSFSIVLSLGFILLVSLLVNAIIAAVMTRFTDIFPQTEVFTSYLINIALTFLTITSLFAIIFKVLPDAKVKWRDVWNGAFTTALLFMGGKFLIGYYLQHSSIGSTFGAAGSVIIILSWVYYSAIILYFGAAYTRANARIKGRMIYPNDYAVWIQTVEQKADQPLNVAPTDIKPEQQSSAEKQIIEGAVKEHPDLKEKAAPLADRKNQNEVTAGGPSPNTAPSE